MMKKMKLTKVRPKVVLKITKSHLKATLRVTKRYLVPIIKLAQSYLNSIFAEISKPRVDSGESLIVPCVMINVMLITAIVMTSVWLIV